MSTEYTDRHGVALTLFWGGTMRGRMIQLTAADLHKDYRELTPAQAREVAADLIAAADLIEGSGAKQMDAALVAWGYAQERERLAKDEKDRLWKVYEELCLRFA